MLSRLAVPTAFLLGVVPLANAAEPELPSFVKETLEALADADVGQLTAAWPRTDGEPEVCERLYQNLSAWPTGVVDENRFALLADLERSVVWVELARGLDDRRFYRGPMRLNRDAEFETVDPGSLPPCEKPELPDAV